MRVKHWFPSMSRAGLLPAAVACLLGATPEALATDPTFTQHIASTVEFGIRDCSAVDVDGDGDLDILSATADDNTLKWLENDGGSPPTFTPHILSTHRRQSNFVRGYDMDGDTDMDILSTSSVDDKIAWYENLGGSPPQFVEHTLTEDPNGVNDDPPGFADGVRQAMAADLDGDGDLDVAHVSVNNDRVAWYENDGGSPPSFTPVVLTDSLDGVRCIELTDIDGDDDIDVIAGAWYGDRIAWFDNQGDSPPTFIERTVWTFTNPADPLWGIAQTWRLHAVDLDGDLDLDILTARMHYGFEWFESDGAVIPTFQRHVIYFADDIGKSVYAADVDGDGDQDAMYCSYGADLVAWYDNIGGTATTFDMHILSEDPDGLGPNNPLQGAADGARAVVAADLDGDGDQDILWAGWLNNTIGWEENHLIDLAATCPQDLNGDNDVGVVDLLDLLGLWGVDPGGPPDFDGDGTVNVLDLLELLAAWGPCPENPACGGPGAESCYVIHESPGCAYPPCCETICTDRPVCCTVGWDIVCKEMAVTTCGHCGEPEAGDCCLANGSPGCNDIVCCRSVCAIDAFCCNAGWDEVCVGEAEQSCIGCP